MSESRDGVANLRSLLRRVAPVGLSDTDLAYFERTEARLEEVQLVLGSHGSRLVQLWDLLEGLEAGNGSD